MSLDHPVPELLDRGPAPEPVEVIFQNLYRLLAADVDIGTHIIKWVTEESPKGRWPPIALALYRHIIEVADAASVLIRQRIDKPCIPLARSQFETWLSFRYLMAGDRDALARSYIYCHYLDGLRATEAFIRRGQPCENSADHGIPYDELLPQALQYQEEVNSLLRSDGFAAIRSEYESTVRRQKTRSPKWYNLFSGPRTVRDLARHVGDEQYYVSLYKHWSGHLHGERTFSSLLSDSAGRLAIDGFRNGFDAPSMTNSLHTCAVHASHLIVEDMIPTKKDAFYGWFMRRRPEIEWLDKVRLVPSENDD